MSDRTGKLDGMAAVLEVKGVIFDFDYTLADSSDGVIECANYALGRLGFPAAPDDAIRRTIGLSLPHSLPALVGDEHAELGDEYMRVFQEKAFKIMPDATLVYEFVPSLVDTLLDRGINIGIVSSGRRRRINAVLQRYGLDGRFGVIVGSEDVETMKPDPTGLRRAVDALSTPIESCLYVGDSVTDAETARRAGVPFVAVLSGVTEREAFAEYAPAMVLGSAGKLPGALGLED
ncbi:MAG: HAD-IA family hydrolase [Chloroflexi bacterium]|nr:HAD-IA family hydrolase [Chloroflexota bacterium]